MSTLESKLETVTTTSSKTATARLHHLLCRHGNDATLKPIPEVVTVDGMQCEVWKLIHRDGKDSVYTLEYTYPR